MSEKRHLELRGNTYWYIRAFPKRLKGKLPHPYTGKSAFRYNLKTSDIAIARKMRTHVSAAFEQMLTRAAKGKTAPLKALWSEAGAYAEFVGDDSDKAGIIAEQLGVTFEEDGSAALQGRLAEIAQQHGDDVAAKFYRKAVGIKPRGTEIEEHLEAFIQANPAKPHQNEKRRRVIGELANWRSGLYVESISIAVAREFLDAKIRPGRKARTINSLLAVLTTYWNWMVNLNLIPENYVPWGRLRLKKADAHATDKRAFTIEEMRKLFCSPVKMRPDLLDCARVAALTGARLEEIAALKVDMIDLAEKAINIPGTKTVNAVRRIPMHSELVALFERRTEGKQPRDWVFDELPERATESLKGRGSKISQAFTRHRRDVGVGAEEGVESEVTFHSFRHWVATQLRESDVNESTIDKLQGWGGKKKKEMQARYSVSAGLMKQMREALELLKLPTEILR